MRKRLIVVSLCFHTFFIKAQEEDIIDVSLEYNKEAADLNDKGYKLLQEKNYKAAETYFKEAIAIEKTNITYFENLGQVYKKTRSFENMLKNYQLAIVYFPEEPDLYYYCGDALQALKRYNKALEAYDKAILMSGDDETVEYLYLYYFNRGNTYLKMERFRSALRDFNKTIALEPYYHGAFNNRGYTKFNLQDKTGACYDWRKALELGNKTVGKYITKYCE
ncbi:MAG: tetratricopeptide repeat protein [Bacteroidota bacterium]